MDRRLALVAAWALFAVASVGVGFGAAGLVGDPFTDGGVTAPAASGSGDSPGTSTPTSSTPTSSTSPTPSDSPSSTSSTVADVQRSVTTRGGFVSGTCRSGLVRLSASPALGWEIDDLDDEPERQARVRFERVDDGDGRVEVQAGCVDGTPRFVVEDDSSGPGSDDDG